MTGLPSFVGGHETTPNWAIFWRHAEWFRVVLVLLFVFACYQFEWVAWRSFICSVFVTLSQRIGLPVIRVSPDSFSFERHLYYFAIACTAMDVFFGSVPLLWRLGRTILANTRFLAIYFICLMAANLFRLELGLVLYSRGVSWQLSHEVMAGFFYFAVFLWIARQRGWTRITSPAHAVS